MKAICVLLAGLLYLHQASANCEQGATFWCSSQENAKSCNAEEYCHENCWSFSGRVKEFLHNQMIKLNAVPDPRLTTVCTSPNVQLWSIRGGICNECKVIIRDLDKVVKNNGTIDSVVVALRFLCNFLPAYSTMCRDIITDLGSMVHNLEPFLNDPEKACEKLRLCPRPGPNSTTPALDTFIQNLYMANTRKWNGNNTICDDCQQACQDIIAQLEDPSQQQSIKETFEELCDYVGPLKRKCIEYIDEFVPQLINWIISRFSDPLGLCTQLGFCRNP